MHLPPFGFALLASMLLFTACRRGPDDSAAQKPVVPVEQAPNSEKPAFTANDSAAGAEVLNAYVQQWNTFKKRPLMDLNELVTEKILPALPPPPAGKQYRLDVAKQKVVLVDAGQ